MKHGAGTRKRVLNGTRKPPGDPANAPSKQTQSMLFKDRLPAECASLRAMSDADRERDRLLMADAVAKLAAELPTKMVQVTCPDCGREIKTGSYDNAVMMDLCRKSLETAAKIHALHAGKYSEADVVRMFLSFMDLVREIAGDDHAKRIEQKTIVLVGSARAGSGDNPGSDEADPAEG